MKHKFQTLLLLAILGATSCTGGLQDIPDAQPPVEVDAGLPLTASLMFVPSDVVRENPQGGIVADSPCNGYLFVDTSHAPACVTVALDATAATTGIYAWSMHPVTPTKVAQATKLFGAGGETHVIELEVPMSNRLMLVDVPLNPGWSVQALDMLSGTCTGE